MTPRPNILFVLVDDMGAFDVGCLGSDLYETPNIDRLRREGMLFTAAYNTPNCAPSRGSILSGRYPTYHGIYTVGSSERGESARRRIIPIQNTTDLPASCVTLAEVLHSTGYGTFFGGKWHLGDGATGPLEQGFDVNVGGNRTGRPRGGYFAPWNNPNLGEAPAGTHLGDYISDRAVEYVRARAANGAKPFFAFVSYYDVHEPFQAKPDLVKKYEAKLRARLDRGIKPSHSHPVYAAMLETLDDNVGRLLAVLDETNLNQRTLVVFSSDNGGEGAATNMRPLRGAKGMPYEGGIRVPLIMRWSGTIKPNSTCDVPVIGQDLYPTFAELAGEKPVAGDGVSLAPLLGGTATILSREAIYWHQPIYLDGIPADFVKDSREGYWRTTPCSTIRAGDWKLIKYYEDGGTELFNLRTDPGERRDRSASDPERARELETRLSAWLAETRAPIPSQPNPAFRPDSPAPDQPRSD